MADEARAMLDALMGADRNAPVDGASGVSSGGGGGGGGPSRRKKSCYDSDVCPLYCAWSLSSQENPTWAESVAVNEGMGGIDIYDLFTNTKSDIGPNPFRVDDHAREEFASLPEHEQRRLGYEDMLARKLGDLVRQCDRQVSRNKEKLRREVAQAMKQRTAGSGKGNREDLITTVNEEMLQQCAQNVATATLIEEIMATLSEKMEQFVEEENKLLKLIEEEERAAAAKGEDGTEPPKKKKKKSKKSKVVASSSATTEDNPDTKLVDPRLLKVEKAKLDTLLELQSLSLKLPPLRDNTDNLLRQLQFLRSDTSTDKVVCEVSGNFMSSRDADERIAAHYAGKQYVGWKLVRDKLKELQKKGFGLGGGGGMGDPRRGGGFRDDRAGYDNRGGYNRGPPRDEYRGGHGGQGYRDNRGGGYGRDNRNGGGNRGRDYDRRSRW